MLKFSKKYVLSIAGVLVVANLVLIIVLLSVKISSSRNYFDKIVDSGTYQAVFLNNNQIYFGHLNKIGSDSEYLMLTDVYYVKIDDDSVGKLVKLGQIEPHGPKDEMIINKDHVLFWENLRFDSQVVKTIRDIKPQIK